MLNARQIEKIKRILSSCRDKESAFMFLRDLSKHLKSNLNEQTIKNIQREYIRHYKQNIQKINQYVSSQVVYNASADTEFYSSFICKKKLIQHSILFLESNDFIEDSFIDETDRLIYNLIKNSENKINSNSIKNYNHGFHQILFRFSEYLRYSSTIHEDFSKEMISFLTNNINNYSERITSQLRIILHSLIIHCGEKIDYNRMVFGENLFSEFEKKELVCIGDILSFDKEYYKNRVLSIKRSNGYMDKKQAVLSHSLDSQLLDSELAQLVGRLSKSNCHRISRNLLYKKELDKEKVSNYARAIIMESKHIEIHRTLLRLLTKSDFVMCLPIFSQNFVNDDYFRRECEFKMSEFQNQ